MGGPRLEGRHGARIPGLAVAMVRRHRRSLASEDALRMDAGKETAVWAVLALMLSAVLPGGALAQKVLVQPGATSPIPSPSITSPSLPPAMPPAEPDAQLTLSALLSGAWCLPDHEGRRGDYEPAAAAAERGEADLGEAGERAVRQVRSSAMPYFSFAQSLRPRG